MSLRCSAAYRKPQLFIEHIRRCALKQRGKTAQCHHSMEHHKHCNVMTAWYNMKRLNVITSWCSMKRLNIITAWYNMKRPNVITAWCNLYLHHTDTTGHSPPLLKTCMLICTSPVVCHIGYMLTQLAYRIDSTCQPATQYVVYYSVQNIHNQQAIFGGF